MQRRHVGLPPVLGVVEGVVEFLEVVHPLEAVFRRIRDVGLVEGRDERQPVLVQDRTRVDHVRHEGRGRPRPRRVHDVQDRRRERRGQRLREQLAGGAPRKGLDLSRRVDDDVVELRRATLQNRHDLVELRRKEVQARDDRAVRPERVFAHHALVVDGVADVDVRVDRRFERRRVQVYEVAAASLLRRVLHRVVVQPMKQRRLPGPRHPDQ
mmetsp:Transcript_25091/g.77437  ORF Transcript_25091/g.77437 Transcript_25091/m.77437 type:complete len:211 (-) Transcript_25091:214-846(-)